MKRAALLAFAACALAACEDPRGRAERFLTVEMKELEKGFGEPLPLPQLRPQEVAPLRIARDPFR